MRAARAALATSATTRWIRHDVDTDDPDGYEAFLGSPWRADAGARPDRDVDPAGRCPAHLHRRRSRGGRMRRCCPTPRASRQGIVYGAITGTTADDVYLNSGPMFHLGTLMHTLATFVAGGTNVFVPRVDAELLCRTIEAERCTGAFLVGPMFEGILEANASGAYDLSSLRSAPGPPEWDAMVSPDTSAWAAHPGGYGQTEAVGMMTFNCLGLGAQRDARPALPARRDPYRRRRRPGGPRGRGRRDRGPGVHRHERLLEPARGQHVPSAGWLAPHERPRTARGGRFAQLHRTEDPHAQVRGREHLPGRGRGLYRAPPRRRRVRGDRRPRPEVGPERQGDRGRARGHSVSADEVIEHCRERHRARTRSRASSSSWTRCRATGSSSTTTRSTNASAAATTPAAGPAAHEQLPFGAFRRRIRVVATSDEVVEAGLEDDFHYFKVALRHDSERVGSGGRRGDPLAVEHVPRRRAPLHALEGMPLSDRCLAVGDWAPPRPNCTHMFDLAGLAVAHAGRVVGRR